MFFKKRDVFEKQLLLKIFRAGGDDDAAPRENRGDEIREGLAGPSAGLDDQMFLIGERGFDGFRHFELSGSIFVGRMPLGEHALAAEEMTGGEGLGGGRHLPNNFSSGVSHQACALNATRKPD